MTDETEARLRAALHAYADQVDDPGAELPQVRPAPDGDGLLHRWRGALLVAAAVAAVVAGVWWIGPGSPGGDVLAGSPADRSSFASSADRAASAPEGPDGAAPLDSPLPGAAAAAGLPADPEVGVPYALDLYTHCGVLGTEVGGRWFAVDPPLVVEYGPPAGWGNPYQPGTLTLTSDHEAVFTDDVGHEVELRSVPDSARPPLCA